MYRIDSPSACQRGNTVILPSPVSLRMSNPSGYVTQSSLGRADLAPRDLPQSRKMILSSAKPFCWPLDHAATIASESCRAAMRADLSSVNGIGQFSALPAPSARIAPGAPATLIAPAPPIENNPDMSRFFARHFLNIGCETCISTDILERPETLTSTTVAAAATPASDRHTAAISFFMP